MIILLLLGYKENLKAALLHASPVSGDQRDRSLIFKSIKDLSH